MTGKIKGQDNTKLLCKENVGYKSRMLIENHITGFLECSIVYTEGKENYVYDTTSKTSLYNIYEHGEMNHKMLYVLY